MSVSVGRGVAPPLFDTVYGVHVYLHVLARLKCLAADRAGVREVARRVHVQNVLFEVAVVAVELAALGTRGLAGLTVSVARADRGRGEAALVAAAAARRCRPARPRRSCRRRSSRSVASPPLPSPPDITLPYPLMHFLPI